MSISNKLNPDMSVRDMKILSKYIHRKLRFGKFPTYDIERMDKALSCERITLSRGLTRDKKREFILSSGE